MWTLQVLKLYVTKEDDASFLYSLEVAEDRYPRIKEEEQLLVDFAGFVDKVVWLFEQCRAQRDDGNDTAQQDHPRSESAPVATKFRAVLQVGGAGAGCMRLVERNAFKELPHLTLHTKAGTDASLKQVSQSSSVISMP